MPRYHFHVHDSTDLPDAEGTDLADLAAAQANAIRLAGAMLLEEKQAFWKGDEWKMDVTDDRGLILFTLVFMALKAPALG